MITIVTKEIKVSVCKPLAVKLGKRFLTVIQESEIKHLCIKSKVLDLLCLWFHIIKKKKKKHLALGIRYVCIMPAPLLSCTRCVSLGKSLIFSQPSFFCKMELKILATKTL